jgi:hypothetical protein
MSIELILYFVDFLKSISSFLSLLTIMFFLVFIICVILAIVAEFDDDKDEKQVAYSYMYKCFKYFVWVAIISFFIPSQSTMYMMLGARYLKDSNLPEKVHELINKKIDELLKDK